MKWTVLTLTGTTTLRQQLTDRANAVIESFTVSIALVFKCTGLPVLECNVNEAEIMDPQQRLLLETVFDSLNAAGQPIEKLRGSSTAVYAGQMCDDWSTMVQQDVNQIPIHTGTGVARSILSNCISYFFDWHGPSMTIDTACSSSLVAVHEAVQILRSGDSKMAVAAGSNLILSPGQYLSS